MILDFLPAVVPRTRDYGGTIGNCGRLPSYALRASAGKGAKFLFQVELGGGFSEKVIHKAANLKTICIFMPLKLLSLCQT